METSLMTLLLFVNLNGMLASKILALLPTPSPSHHHWNRALMLALASRGHEITVLSPDQEKAQVPNHRDIVIEGAYEQFVLETDELGDDSEIERIKAVFQFGQEACDYALSTNGTKILLSLRDKQNFDLIIAETVFEECILAFIPIFGNPAFIGITAFGNPPWVNNMVGSPVYPSVMSTYMLPYGDQMSFVQRLNNFIHHLYTLYYRSYHHLPYMDAIAKKYLGDNIPPISEIEKNVSLVLVNTHFSLDYHQPLVPAMIPVGGMHITQGKLNKDLKRFLDEAEHGAIFFSFGSNIRSDKMTDGKIKAFVQAFSELPQRVLWKWESNTLANKSDNVLVEPWLPQNDILAHKRTVLFITHGGRLSIQEAMYHGVPILGMPFMADQFINVEKMVDHALGEKLQYESLSTETILKAIQNVITNTRYQENARKYSDVMRDQPESPLQRAIYWTEYVIRHKGAPHLHAASVNLSWVQYLLLDVSIVLLMCVVVILFLFLQMMSITYHIITVTFKNSIKLKQL